MDTSIVIDNQLDPYWILKPINGDVIYVALGIGVNDELLRWWMDVIAYTDSIIEPEFAIVETNNPLTQLVI